MGVSSYRELRVWQVGMSIAEQIYRMSAAFPKQELYGLTSQMQRAAVSIPSNVAEGHARASTKEYLHHLSIALGSLAELETQLILAERLRYTGETSTESLLSQMDELGKMLRSLQKSLKSKLASTP
ncbi:MAG: four helix bundle protein [Leptolyngbyaceae cyanobacterium SM1_4_3]|nr:four helix bundle protein [Leptolyngbyaceae cyanobacterium SM1_4_3]NJN91833.1 four helix bundle protein [Leptolyngbyaceae cyanobacterium SL_5_14]